MILKNSGVVFNPVDHTYILNGKMLNGITHVIKDKLFADEYKNVPENILRQAAQRGSEIHKVIEMWDACTIKTYGSIELQNYIDLSCRNNFLKHHVKSEYLVTDGEKFASAIDKVYEDSHGGVILADIKTTYKLNMDYVSWQLSIYKYFFNLANPDINVSGLYVIWLRGEKSAVWQVHEHSEEEIKKLLYTGEVPKQLLSEEEFEKELLDLKLAYEKTKEAYEKKRDEVVEYLNKNNIQSYKGIYCNITIKNDSVRRTFDSKKFKENEPIMYEQYLKETISKGGVLITTKK